MAGGLVKKLGIAAAGWAALFSLISTCILFHPDAWATEMTLLACLFTGLSGTIRLVDHLNDINKITLDILRNSKKWLFRLVCITAISGGVVALIGFIGYTAEISDDPTLMSHRRMAASYTCLAMSLPGHIQNIVVGFIQVRAI